MLLFVCTTNPSEFASSLNKIGVKYSVSYAVALALRYIPDIQKDYHDISQAQQARGIELGTVIEFTFVDNYEIFGKEKEVVINDKCKLERIEDICGALYLSCSLRGISHELEQYISDKKVIDFQKTGLLIDY